MPKLPDSIDRRDLRAAAGRRKFLKVAATTAPLVATLPSGAAWASSTSQCIKNAIEDSTAGIAPVQNLPPPDTYIRYVGQRVTFTRDPDTQIVYHITAMDTGGTERFWLDDGNEFDPTPVGEDPWLEETTPRENVSLLKVFQPDPDAENPTTVTECIPGSKDAKPVPTCLYPVSRIGSGNIAMPDSCMGSVNPGAESSRLI